MSHMKYKDVKERLDKCVRDLLEKGATEGQIERWADEYFWVDGPRKELTGGT